MKKLLIVLLCMTVLLGGCSFHNEEHGDAVGEQANQIEKTVNDAVPAKAKVYSYEPYIGDWYGFGTSGYDAQFNTTIQAIDDEHFKFIQDGYGNNSCSQAIDYIMHMVSNNRAESQPFSSYGDTIIAVIDFGISKYDELFFESYYVYADSHENRGQTSLNIKDSVSYSIYEECYGDYNDPKCREFNLKAKDVEKRANEMMRNAGPQSELNESSYKVYQMWDDLLNEIYGYLKNTMDKSEFEKLGRDELDWINEKEAAVAETASRWSGGSGGAYAQNSVAIEYTRDRCFVLMFAYVNR